MYLPAIHFRSLDSKFWFRIARSVSLSGILAKSALGFLTPNGSTSILIHDTILNKCFWERTVELFSEEIVMKLSPFQLFLNSMRVGAVRWGFLPKEEAYKRMKEHTRQDFGFDLERWKQWGREHPEVSGMKPEPPSQAEEICE